MTAEQKALALAEHKNLFSVLGLAPLLTHFDEWTAGGKVSPLKHSRVAHARILTISPSD